MLSVINANMLNKIQDPVAQKVSLGTEVRNAQVNSLCHVTVNINADASAGISFTVPEAMELVDVIVQCRATVSGGTMQVRTGTTAITNAIVCATDTNVVKVTTIDDGYSVFTAGQTLNIIAAHSTDRGLVTLVGYRV